MVGVAERRDPDGLALQVLERRDRIDLARRHRQREERQPPGGGEAADRRRRWRRPAPPRRTRSRRSRRRRRPSPASPRCRRGYRRARPTAPPPRRSRCGAGELVGRHAEQLAAEGELDRLLRLRAGRAGGEREPGEAGRGLSARPAGRRCERGLVLPDHVELLGAAAHGPTSVPAVPPARGLKIARAGARPTPS